MNCPPHSLPTGCSSQTASLWLLPQGHKASKHTLPSVGFSLSMSPQVLPGPCSCGVTVYCRHIHLLSSGFIHRLQGDLCTPMDLQGLLQSCFSMLFMFSVLLQTLLKQVAHLVILIANASNDFNFMWDSYPRCFPSCFTNFIIVQTCKFHCMNYALHKSSYSYLETWQFPQAEQRYLKTFSSRFFFASWLWLREN